MGGKNRGRGRRVGRELVRKTRPRARSSAVTDHPATSSKGPTDYELLRHGDEFWDIGPGEMDHQSSAFGPSVGGTRWW